MISMTHEQTPIFASALAVLAMPIHSEEDEHEHTTLLQLTPQELGIVGVALMLADCCIPVRMAVGEGVRDLMKKTADVMNEQHGLSDSAKETT